MITVVVGSNRKENLSKVIGDIYRKKLEEIYKGEVGFVNIEDMPSDVLSSEMYTVSNKWIKDIRENYIIPADKLIFIIPEYNGTFPGALKLFIDALSTFEAEKSFYGKKAALVGISAGKFGNWLGLEHFGVVLNYIKMNVYYQKVSISNIWNFLDDKLNFDDPKTSEYIDKQIEGFLKF